MKALATKFELRETAYSLGGAFKPLEVWKQQGYDIYAIETLSLPQDVMPSRMFGYVYRVPELSVHENGKRGNRSETSQVCSGKKQRIKLTDAATGADDEAKKAEDEAKKAEDEAMKAEDEAVKAEDEAKKAEDASDDDSSSESSSSSSSSSAPESTLK